MLKRNLCIILCCVFFFTGIVVSNGGIADEILNGTIISIPEKESPQTGCFQIASNQEQTGPRKSPMNFSYIGVKKYWGAVRYYNYYVYRDIANNWYAMLGLNLTPVIYHTKGGGSKGLSFTIAQSYSSQTASAFSTSIGGAAGVGDMVQASVAFNYGRTHTQSRTYSISSTIEATIPSSAQSGYYKMHVCHDYYAMKIIQKRLDGSNAVERIIDMPYGETYSAVLYSSNNSTWARY